MDAIKAPAPLRHVLIRIRLFSSFATGLVLYALLPASLAVPTRLLIAWNVAILTYLVLIGVMMARSTHETMQKRAQVLDEGRGAVLILSMLAALSSLAAVVFELFNLKQAPTSEVAVHVGLSVATILTSWTFVHVIFTEHYAHAFYLRDDGAAEGAKGKGLHFPGQPKPDYLDFLYFSFTIGVANQTADTEIVSRGMRLLVLIHSVISYFFNTTILALTINIAASMLGG